MQGHVLLTVTDLFLLIVAAVNIVFGVFVLVRDVSDRANISYAVLSTAVFTWIGSIVVLNRGIFGGDSARCLANIIYIAGLVIPVSAVYFVMYFGGRRAYSRSLLFFVDLMFIFLSILVIAPDMVIKSVAPYGIRMSYGDWYIVYATYLIGVFLLGFWYLYKFYLSSHGKKRVQLKLFFIGSFASAAVAAFTNVIFPFFNIFDWFMLGPAFMIVMTSFIGYSVIKFGMWNFRKVITEVLVSSLVILAAIDLIFKDALFTTQVVLIFRAFVLLVTLIVGHILIKTVRDEQRAVRKLRRLNKRLKELDQKKTEFLHIATHQMRGPLTSINGYAQLLTVESYGNTPPGVARAASRIIDSGRVLTDIINDYMNVARIEEKRLTIEPENFLLCELVRQRVKAFQTNADKKHITLKVTPPPEPCAVHADKKTITQIVNALIENAIKYTPDGGQVHVWAERSEDGTRGYMHVQDTGVGIAKKDLKKVFKKFVRIKTEHTQHIFGTGMGMYIAKELAKANHGKLTVDSEGEGKGTTFTLELPVLPPDSEVQSVTSDTVVRTAL